jgi:hypothetical protein
MEAEEELGLVISAAVNEHVKAGGKASLVNAAAMTAGFKFLLKRIEKLEALPFEYAGIHESQKRYFKNQFVTHGGRVWACVVDYTIQQPGTTEDWKLAVNKGRDGKDAK